MRCAATGKVRHASRGAAIAALTAVANHGLSAYPCPRCHGWHLGNHPKKRLARIIQLLDQDKARHMTDATPPHPELAPVTSSNIEAVGQRDGDLFIRFKGGAVYRYPAAAAAHHDALLAAPSIGSYFHGNIRHTLKGEKIT